MIKSMTGFGRGSAEGEGAKVTVDIRTVNNRYLDTHVRIPQDHAALELSVKKQIQAALKRGRVDVTVAVARSIATTASVVVDANNRVPSELSARLRTGAPTVT